MVKRYFLIALLLGISSNATASIDWSSPSTCNIEDSENLDEIINQMTLRQNGMAPLEELLFLKELISGVPPTKKETTMESKSTLDMLT